jgi:signal transduction histidine kinase
MTKLHELIDKTSVGHRAVADRHFRTLLFTGIGLSWNLVYGIFNGILGIIDGSPWFLILCLFYLVLCLMRFSVMPRNIRKRHNYEAHLLIFNGVIMLILAIVLSFTVLYGISESVRKSYPMIVMIGIATYTFSVTVIAIINFIKAQKEKSAFMITVRNISLAAATASMMSLERSMISTFSDKGICYFHTMDACTGAGGFLIVLALGISMIITGGKRNESGNL